MKNAAYFPVTINKNNHISLFDTETIISCMSKACFYKLQPKPVLVESHRHRVNGTKCNGLGPSGMTTCILEFPQKFTSNS